MGIRPVQIQQPDPIEQYGKSLALKNLLQQGDIQQRGIDDDAAVRGAYQQAGGDSARLRALLQQGGQYKPLQALDKFELDKREKESQIRSHEASAAKSKYDVHIDEIQRRSSILSTAKDQASWDVARRAVALQDPEVGAQLPQQFDPALLKTRLAEGQTLVQKLSDERARDATAETARGHDITQQGQNLSAATARRGQDLTDARAAERLALDRDSPKGILDPERGLIVDPRTAQARPVTVDGQPVAGKLTDSQKKELSSIDSQKSVIQGALKSVAASPDAFGMRRGMATMSGAIPESIAGRMDSDEQRQSRSYVFNVVSKVINERAGAAQSAQELARLRSFLPAETDNAAQIKSKLEGFDKYLDDSRTGYEKPQTAKPAAAAPEAPKAQTTYDSMPDPATLKGRKIRADDGTVYVSDGAKWKRQQ